MKSDMFADHRTSRQRTQESQSKGSTVRKSNSWLAAACCLVLVAGCSSGSSKTTSVIVNPSGGLATMPAPPPPTPVNTYTGTESLGVWSLQLDDTQSTYAYSTSIGSAPAANGAFTATNGFLSLGQANGVSLGYILEVPGRMALLRPGAATAPLVVAVPQTTCYSLPYVLRFEYVAMEAAPGFGQGRNYGSVAVSSSGDGSTWQYEDLIGSSASGPAVFPGGCSVASGAANLSIPGPTIFNTQNNSSFALPGYDGSNLVSVATSLNIGPSGIIVSRQSEGDPATVDFRSAAIAGIAEPAQPLSTSSIVAGSYLGFMVEAQQSGVTSTGGTFLNPASSSPASFMQAAGSSSTMLGGLFPNDDVTTIPNSDTSITLGAQSSTLNGFYPKALVTRPDPNQNCAGYYPAGVGTDSNGYFTCTFPAVAIVGISDGKYAVFLNAFDYTAGSASTLLAGTPMQIYLYQQ